MGALCGRLVRALAVFVVTDDGVAYDGVAYDGVAADGVAADGVKPAFLGALPPGGSRFSFSTKRTVALSSA